MTFYESNHHTTPMDQPQEDKTIPQNNIRNLDRTVSATDSSLSSSTGELEEKDATTYQNTLDRHPTHPDQSLRPEISRALSFGAAAPYAAPACFLSLDGVSHSVSRRPSISSEKTLERIESQLPSASRVSTDAQGFTYPEGGLQAWLCVFGSFCGMVSQLLFSRIFLLTIFPVQRIGHHEHFGNNTNTCHTKSVKRNG